MRPAACLRRAGPLLLTFTLGVRAQTLDVLVYPNPGVVEAPAGVQPHGPGVALLERLSGISGVTLRVQAMPVARAQQMISTQPGHCAAGVPRTPEREAAFRWAGLMASGALMLYGRTDEAHAVASAKDLRGRVVAAQRESRPLDWLREHGLKAYEVNDTATGLRMLQAGRVDFWLVNDLAARRAIQHSDAPRPSPCIASVRSTSTSPAIATCPQPRPTACASAWSRCAEMASWPSSACVKQRQARSAR
ncbi:substrate-binding periplasmic protein [Roseateles sp.]|uniref:substrate-binding periplasmic protein n=1 Tax=Roseateles sp. TaxID=1971397 RepID=UPI0039ECD9EF